jgi:NAD-reducing hydrogenase small subunit
MTDKLRMATVSLAGCFGCHMSLLDIDERLSALLERVELNRSPFTDIKVVGDCDIGLIEGGVANAENIHVLRDFRKHCKVLVAVGACALNGGVPALRNQVDLRECLEASYIDEVGLENPHIPDDPEIPLLLSRVRPVHEVVKVDYFVPGCPPSADTLWTFLTELIEGRPIAFPYGQLRYD